MGWFSKFIAFVRSLYIKPTKVNHFAPLSSLGFWPYFALFRVIVIASHTMHCVLQHPHGMLLSMESLPEDTGYITEVVSVRRSAG